MGVGEGPADQENQPPNRSQYYASAEEAQAVGAMKQTSKATTESARNALKVAEETRAVAAANLGELERNRHQLGAVDAGLDQVRDDTREAKSTLGYMRWARRCCCCLTLFSCCCSCDPHAKRDASRRERTRGRKRQHKLEVGARARSSDSAFDERRSAEMLEQKAAKAGVLHLADATDSLHIARESLARASLARASAALDVRGGLLNRLSKNVADPADRREIAQHVAQQEAILAGIGDASTDILSLAKRAHEEVKAQNQMLDTVGEKHEATNQGVRNVGQDVLAYRRTGR